MRLVFRTRIGPTVILAGYVTLPVCAFVWWGWGAALVGLCLAHGVDRLYPRWYAELTWRGVWEAVHRLHESRSEGSGISFLIRSRRATLLRHKPGEVPRLGLLLPLADWGDLLTEETEDAFGKHGAGVWWRDGLGARSFFFARATTEDDAGRASIRMLRYAVDLAGADLAADVLIRPWGVVMGAQGPVEDGGSRAQ